MFNLIGFEEYDIVHFAMSIRLSSAGAFHVIARGWTGPSLHQPFNRKAERYTKEGVPISLSTLADQGGGCRAVPASLFKPLSAERSHGNAPRFRSGPKARPISAGSGSMCATKGLLG